MIHLIHSYSNGFIQSTKIRFLLACKMPIDYGNQFCESWLFELYLSFNLLVNKGQCNQPIDKYSYKEKNEAFCIVRINETISVLFYGNQKISCELINCNNKYKGTIIADKCCLLILSIWNPLATNILQREDTWSATSQW